jgi:hypothetical protein
MIDKIKKVSFKAQQKCKRLDEYAREKEEQRTE